MPLPYTGSSIKTRVSCSSLRPLSMVRETLYLGSKSVLLNVSIAGLSRTEISENFKLHFSNCGRRFFASPCIYPIWWHCPRVPFSPIKIHVFIGDFGRRAGKGPSSRPLPVSVLALLAGVIAYAVRARGVSISQKAFDEVVCHYVL